MSALSFVRSFFRNECETWNVHVYVFIWMDLIVRNAKKSNTVGVAFLKCKACNTPLAGAPRHGRQVQVRSPISRLQPTWQEERGAEGERANWLVEPDVKWLYSNIFEIRVHFGSYWNNSEVSGAIVWKLLDITLLLGMFRSFPPKESGTFCSLEHIIWPPVVNEIFTVFRGGEYKHSVKQKCKGAPISRDFMTISRRLN